MAAASLRSLIAHRGWSERFPENSLPAFAAAVAAGADEIEFDVRSSSDLVPYVCHDDTLDRTSNLKGPGSAHSAFVLSTAAIRQPNGELLEGIGFPLLSEVVDMFGGLVRMNVHFKRAEDVARALDLLTLASNARGKLDAYIAGDVSVVEAALRLAPQVPRCIVCLPGDAPPKMIETGRRLRCTRIQFFRGHYDHDDVLMAQRRGLLSNLFWADEPSEAADAFASGIDAVLTNDIGPMKAAAKRS